MFRRTPQAQALSLQRRPESRLPATQGCRILRITPSNAFHHERGVQRSSYDWAHMIEARRERKNTVNAHPPKCGLEPDNAAQGGRNANGSTRVAANGGGT